jgi:hypothetical protein
MAGIATNVLGEPPLCLSADYADSRRLRRLFLDCLVIFHSTGNQIKTIFKKIPKICGNLRNLRIEKATVHLTNTQQR